MASTTTLAWMTDAHREFVVKPEGHMIATKRRAQSEGIDEDMTDISHQLKRSKVELITWQQKRPWDLCHEEAGVIVQNGVALEDKLIDLHNNGEELDPDLLRASVRLGEYFIANGQHNLAIEELEKTVNLYRTHQGYGEEDRYEAELAFAAALVLTEPRRAVSILSKLRKRISLSLLLTCLILQAEAWDAYGSQRRSLKTMQQVFQQYHGPEQAASHELRPLINLLGVHTKTPRTERLTELLQGFVEDCQARLPKNDIWLQRIQIRLAERKLQDEQFDEGIALLEPLVQDLCPKTGALTDDSFWSLMTLMELYEDKIASHGDASEELKSRLKEIQKQWSPSREWHSVVDNVRLRYYPNVPDSDSDTDNE